MPDSRPNDSMQRRQFVRRGASVVGASALLSTEPLLGADAPQDACGKPQRAALEARVIAKAWRDPRYLQNLKRNPSTILSRELRTEIPGDLRIRVVEEQPNQIYFVIPVNPNQFSEKRVSQDQLQLVAAGIRFDTPCVTVSSVMPAWFAQLQYFPRSRDV